MATGCFGVGEGRGIDDVQGMGDASEITYRGSSHALVLIVSGEVARLGSAGWASTVHVSQFDF